MEKFKYISIVLLLLFFASCEKDLMTYKGGDRIQFEGDSVINKTFVFTEASKLRDTVLLKINTLGGISSVDRQISLEQMTEKEWVFQFDEEGNKTDSSYVEITNRAEAGVHFVALSDSEIMSKFVIKGNTVEAEIPIIILRDVSLKNNSFRLRLRIKENEFFAGGEVEQVEKVIVITDNFVKPSNWSSTINFFFGQYGPVKHEFMHNVTGLEIDESFLDQLIKDYSQRLYYQGLFIDELRKYNEANPDAPLREAPEEGQSLGDLVSFSN